MRALALLVAASPIVPLGSPAQAAAGTVDTVALEVVVEDAGLTLRSSSPTPLLVLLASAERDVVTARWMVEGERVRMVAPPGFVDGLWLETLAVEPGRWIASGALQLDTGGGAGALLTTTSSGDAWGRGAGDDGAPSHGMVPVGTLLPERMHRHAGRDVSGDLEAPTHVPVPPPSDTPPDGDTPPELEKDPLPPV